jgi:predicted dehydrogenase
MAATMVLAMRQARGLRAVAVASASGRAGEFAARHGLRPHADAAALCADPAIDLVYVANANHLHAASSIQALRAGKAVLCEKPFALTPEEARAVAAAAEASGRFFMEGIWTLTLPALCGLADLAARGGLGELRHFEASFGYPLHDQDLPRLTDPQEGGVLFDRAGYGLAQAISLLGPPEEMTVLSGPGARRVLLALCHGSGATSQITVAADALLANRVTLSGSLGAAGLHPPALGHESLWQTGFAPQPILAPAGQPGLKARLRALPVLRRLKGLLAGGQGRWLPWGADPYLPMLDHVADCLARGQRGSERVPLSLSLAVHAALSLAQSRLGGEAP